MKYPLLVLDLDETLWYGTETAEGAFFQLRPHLRDFLKGVTEAYDLAVWTNATQEWMQAGLRVILAETDFDLAGRAVFPWDRTRSTLRRTEDGGYEWRKPARKFRAPWIRRRYPRERILVVDDQPQNYACGYGHLVRVRVWTDDAQDDELLHLASYLGSLAAQPNLTRVEKRGWRAGRPSESSATV